MFRRPVYRTCIKSTSPTWRSSKHICVHDIPACICHGYARSTH
ncbi:hypothetical protein RSAG8_12908, partial [Rhizoctonia solani AG-8 WAC10335]